MRRAWLWSFLAGLQAALLFASTHGGVRLGEHHVLLVCLPLTALLTYCAFRLRREVLHGPGRRMKSVDTGTGILFLSERGGPLSAAFLEEIRLWQAAGEEELRRLGDVETAA